MLKCGQKDNENYTFGIRREEQKLIKKDEGKKKCCSNCGVCSFIDSKYCPGCGEVF